MAMAPYVSPWLPYPIPSYGVCPAPELVVTHFYASVTMPLQNCINFPVSTSYLRTKSSVPSLPMRYTTQAGRERGDGVAVAHGHRHNARRDQQAPARIDAEGAQMDRARFAMLDQRRLASGLVDRENRNVVLAAVGNLLAFEVNDPGIAVGHIDELPRGMDVDRSAPCPGRTLPGSARVVVMNRGSGASKLSGCSL